MNLADQQCRHAVAALDAPAIDALLPQVPGWTLEDGKLRRSFAFRDYHQTIDFVNHLAEMVHQQDHHPELTVTYNRCVVRFNTHSVGGISANDFICAARASAIYDARTGA